MAVPFTAAEFRKEAFNCVHCGAYARQRWSTTFAVQINEHIRALDLAFCSHCGRFSVWVEQSMVHPAGGTAALPNADLSEDIRADYEEARAILGRSPRGASAILRLCIQKLCVELGQPGKNLNDDIGALVKKGLSADVTKALDIVRVIGNSAVHPGQIDIKDDPETAHALFVMVNFIAEKMLTEPRQLESLYTLLPKGAKQQIELRDKKS